MQLLLLFVAAVVAIAVLVLAQPTARNIATAQLGALGCVLAGACALLWHEYAAAVGISVLALALLWVFWRTLTWPIRYVASVFRDTK